MVDEASAVVAGVAEGSRAEAEAGWVNTAATLGAHWANNAEALEAGWVDNVVVLEVVATTRAPAFQGWVWAFDKLE